MKLKPQFNISFPYEERNLFNPKIKAKP